MTRLGEAVLLFILAIIAIQLVRIAEVAQTWLQHVGV